jgi:acyl carrier protein
VSNRVEVLESMKKVIAEQLDADASQVSESTSFVDDLGADSLAVVELVLAMEETFDVAIPDDEAEKLRTVGEAVDYVMAHSGKKGTPKAAAS